MLSAISNYRYNTPINYKFNNSIPHKFGGNLAPLQHDTVSFTGMSAPSHYKSVFDYLAADILSKNKKYQVDGSMLSATNIQTAINKLFSLNKVYGPYTTSNPEKIHWKPYIPEDVRVFSTDKINDARASRLQQWQKFLEAPQSEESAAQIPKLVEHIKQNKSLRFVIWNAVNSELKSNNRHIPVPFDATALYKTIVGFDKIDPLDRAVRCARPSFLEMYTHRLRDILLEKKGLSDNTSVWVKIPSIKSAPESKADSISTLEILSSRNWCTRSSVDKAEAALEDGDFYIYLERKGGNQWNPLIGMACSKGKIDQIQGIENNNIIPTSELENIKEFIKSHGLKCNSDIVPEGPKALQQIMIAEKLVEYDETLGKTLEKAIKDGDDYGILKFMSKKIDKLEDGKFEIATYKPSYNVSQNSGISIPYSMLGIDEDLMLQNVEKINGDLILDHKNPLFASTLRKFPPSLKTVTGKIVCSEEQFAQFGEDFARVTGNRPGKVIVHSNF